ncbi:MAG: tetratricopeptide repeat protein [Bradyrhizobiaceae bacterium]|nr:tetratricopeptide repeat protein [Bradyrhizobiaceae bacterium]
MKTLYELLGANADDDAETLEKAFRKAVKAHHPDLHPDDPDAQAHLREIIAAHAILRDTEQRANYDYLLQLERERFLTLASRQLQSRPAPQQLQSKWIIITAVIAAVGARIGGYGLATIRFLTLARRQFQSRLALEQLRSNWILTTAVIAAIGALIGGYGVVIRPMAGNVEVNTDMLAANMAVENQTAIAVAAAKENQNPLSTVGAAKADAGNGNNADEPVEPMGTVLMQQANPADPGERRYEHDGAGVLNGATEASPKASEKENADIAEPKPALGTLSNNAHVYKALGMASYRSGDFPQAIASFDAAILLDPGDAQAYDIRGNAWDEMGVFKNALGDYEESIRIDPDNPAVFHDRAIMWHRKGELDKALIDLDRAIRFSFSEARAYCDRGLVWYEKGHRDRAIADFNHAVRLDPNSAAACIRRGLILHRDSQFKLTSATINQAVRVDPNIFDALRSANLRP